MIFQLIRKHFANSHATVSVRFQLENEQTDYVRILYEFECTGLDIHNMARSAKKLLLKNLKAGYGNSEGQVIYSKKWDVFTRGIIETHTAFLTQKMSDSDYHPIIREFLCGVIEEAFDDFVDGEVLTVKCLFNSEVHVVGYHVVTGVERLKVLGNINEDAGRRKLYKILGLNL